MTVWGRLRASVVSAGLISAFLAPVPMASAATGIMLSSWTVEVGSDRNVTILVHTSGGGGLQSPFAGSNSVLGARCRIAATGAEAFDWTPVFGAEELVATNTYEVGPGIMHPAPSLTCLMEAVILKGNDGSTALYETAELQAAGLTLKFTIPGNQPEPPSVKVKSFIAMGDSYSSGEGNPPFDAGTATGQDTCHRSSKAWPRELSRLNASGVHITGHIACSGAKISAFRNSFKAELPQLTQLAALPKPDIVTLTLGGNDIGFASILQACYVGPTSCARKNGPIDQARFTIKRPHGLVPALTKVINDIKRTVPEARIILVGYPNIFPTTQAASVSCGWLTRDERPALGRLAGDLDAASRQAAKAANAEYVSTLTVMAGHEECTPNSWMVPIGKRPIQLNGHPRPLGQLAIATKVQDYLRGTS